MEKVIQFINDFKKSPALEALLTDSTIEPIMIWVAGSVWLGTADQDSDYDLCILVKELPKEDSTSPWLFYGRPNSHFLWYKPQMKKVDLIYTSVDEIFLESKSTSLANVGWSQIKYWPEQAIIYKNPKYLDFINTLFDNKEKIFRNSIYLFLKSALLSYTQNNTLSELIYRNTQGRPDKLLANACWASDLLQNKELNINNILAIKRNLYENLSQDIKNYITEALKYLDTYLIDMDKNIDSITELQKCFKRFNLIEY